MGIFSLLDKYQRRRTEFKKSEEYRFFLENREALNRFPKYAFLYDSDIDDFNVMRANCFLYGLTNKDTIEKEVINLDRYLPSHSKADNTVFKKALEQRLVDLPYMMSNKEKIFIPFFPKSINLIYVEEPDKLLKEPYHDLIKNYTKAIVDPFDTYGAELYNSYFTRLVKIFTNDKEVAYFHYDTHTIYIVNMQGRLDAKIVLFDKYMKRISDHHMLERIRPVVEAYFNYNRSDFIQKLYENGFISPRMLTIIHRKSKV
ncbi:MAG: hypothetical protein GXY57_04460 [Erysipelotrichaceae bacterium]|nr:hypothetical protein [Bacilli bacterium]NLV29385.1 hypothetical protein [Erysipelotrichaceae bacterium]HPY79893.1 hypothetical protein [Bacilli bacterium]HQA55877.1 hypothetical protein [Bacilli bacterium]